MDDNNILTFCFTVVNKNCHVPVYFYTRLPVHKTKETAFWAIFSFRICKVSQFIELLYWSENFVTRPETELISQFLVIQISSTKFQSMCFTMKL